MPARLGEAAIVISVTFDDGWADNVTAASIGGHAANGVGSPRQPYACRGAARAAHELTPKRRRHALRAVGPLGCDSLAHRRSSSRVNASRLARSWPLAKTSTWGSAARIPRARGS
jgi:hypothetical protein